MIGDDEPNFPYKLLLTNRQFANLRKAFENFLSANIKLSKTQISTLIISNDEMEDIIKIVKYLEDSSLLLKGSS